MVISGDEKSLASPGNKFTVNVPFALPGPTLLMTFSTMAIVPVCFSVNSLFTSHTFSSIEAIKESVMLSLVPCGIFKEI